MIVNLLITIFKMREVWILLIFLGLFMIIAVLVKNYIDNNSCEDYETIKIPNSQKKLIKYLSMDEITKIIQKAWNQK